MAVGNKCFKLFPVTLNNRQRADTVIGVIWAVGMAFGIILVDLTPGIG
ncbi:metal ABC transporter permease [uncultured Desulfobacter sp.]|nr:metal ABC transporter permease [uncultured Desulfobacter sp.]